MRNTFFLTILIMMSACSNEANVDDGSVNANVSNNVNSEITPSLDGSDTSQSANSGENSNDTLTLDNAELIIRQAFEVFSGAAYDNRLVSFPTIYQASTVAEGEIFPSSFKYQSFECQNNGEHIDSSTTEQALETLYTNCEIDNELVNGQISLTFEDRDDWTSRFSDGYRIDFLNNGVMEVAGSYTRQGDYSYSDNFAVSNFNYYLAYSGGTLRVKNANTKRTLLKTVFGSNEQQTSSISGSFTMFPPAIDNTEVMVDIASAFTNYDSATQLSYSQGLMHISANDSVITLDADNGDAQSVLVSVKNSNEMVSTVTMDWATWQNALAYTPPLSLASTTTVPSASGDGNLISENTYQAVLKTIFDIVTGERFGAAIIDMPKYTFPEFPLALTSSSADGFGDAIVEQCGGGDSYLLPYKFGTRQITHGWDARFSDCTSNDVFLNGSFLVRDYGNFNHSATNFTQRTNQETQFFNGNQSYKHTNDRDGGPTRHYGFSGHYKYLNGTDDFEIQGIHTANYIHGYLNQLLANFSFRSNETSQQWVNVDVIDPLLSFNSPFPENNAFSSRPKSGLMRIDAGNGNTMLVVASNADPDTFSIFIYQSNSAVYEKVLSWEDVEQHLDFNFDLHTR